MCSQTLSVLNMNYRKAGSRCVDVTLTVKPAEVNLLMYALRGPEWDHVSVNVIM